MPAMEHASIPFRDDIATIVDVGASRGQFATFAADRFPAARLVCFEPLPGARDRLRKVTRGRATIHGAAVGAERGRATFNVSNQDDSSSLLPIGDLQVAEFPGTGRAGSIDVEITTLADVGLSETPPPRLLKIDVQGSELDVLRGAGDELRLFEQLFVECSFVELYEGQALADEVVAFLLNLGFRLRGVFGMTYSANGHAVQADLLFSRS